MKWAFWAVGAIALIWAVDVHEAANPTYSWWAEFIG